MMVSPLVKTALSFIRLNLPKISYGQTSVNENSGVEQILNSIVSMGIQLGQFFGGFNNTMYNNGYCKKFAEGESWVRLCSPDFKKKASGYRVKTIKISDEWANMAHPSHETQTYEQQFTYTTDYTFNGQTYAISSGVAAYEPLIGGDENPWRQPTEFLQEKNLFAPDNEHFQEMPLGESFFRRRLSFTEKSK